VDSWLGDAELFGEVYLLLPASVPTDKLKGLETGNTGSRTVSSRVDTTSNQNTA